MVKPAVDILKTIILPVLQEFPEVQSRIDVAGKDLVSGFLELCFSLTVAAAAREGVCSLAGYSCRVF